MKTEMTTLQEAIEQMKEQNISEIKPDDPKEILVTHLPERVLDIEGKKIVYVVLVRTIKDVKKGEFGDIRYVILDEDTMMNMRKQIYESEKMRESESGMYI